MKKLITLAFLTLFSISVFAQDQAVKPKNGWDYFAAGQYQESLKALESERQSFPERMDIYVIEGWCYRELKDWANMERISAEGLKIQPNDPRALKNIGDAMFWQGKYQQAVQYYDGYLKYKYQPKTDTNYATVYYRMALCYYNLKQWLKADICFSLHNRYKPNDYLTIMNLADVKEKLGEYNKAYNLYQQTLKIRPNNQRGLEGVNRLKDKVTS
jgi:tetratricopeptide (TPR) repeat protein